MANGNDGPFKDEGRHMTRGSEPALTPGPQDADIIWLFDLTAGAGIWSHDAAHSSIIVWGDYVYLNTGTGVDRTHKAIQAPDAPSLVVLDKHTGRLVAREREQMAPNIFHNTWAAPSLAEVNGRPLVFFNGGNGIVYAFEALPKTEAESTAATAAASEVMTLRKVWQFDFDPSAPKTNVHRYNSDRQESPSNFFGMPVFWENRLYVAGGGDIWWGKNQAWLKCINPTLTGDITTNGLIWSYPLQKHVLGTPAVWHGLLFIADCGRNFHCVDAETGQAYWTHELHGEAWASPLAADGKVYLGTREGFFYIFAAEKHKKVLAEIDLVKPISATCAAGNGTLFVAAMDRLYAVQKASAAARSIR
jgi:outer membrane protein assembly factor BamB